MRRQNLMHAQSMLQSMLGSESVDAELADEIRVLVHMVRDAIASVVLTTGRESNTQAETRFWAAMRAANDRWRETPKR